MPTLRFTKRSVAELPHPAVGQKLYRDEILRGFGVRIGSKSKVFFVEGQVQSFALWLTRENGDAKQLAADEIAQELPKYITNVVQERFDDSAFLRAEALTVLVSACEDVHIGNDAKEWLASFVYHAT
ncbi:MULTISPECIES: hypothetical protein [unclassified Ruegeria]|uniref:hypothetical protein n=1 Tax=unclassified Ruegeria TaxID=2625375 RepID=UPI001487E3F5|nr:MULTISPECIES: hypothetical protein [unclassified Ruegeria]